MIVLHGAVTVTRSIDSIPYRHRIRNDYRLCSYNPCPDFGYRRCTMGLFCVLNDLCQEEGCCSRSTVTSALFCRELSRPTLILPYSGFELDLMTIQWRISIRLVLSNSLCTHNSIAFIPMHAKFLPVS